MTRPLPDARQWISLPQAMDAWHQGDGTGIRVAVIDSGVDSSHPGLAGLELSDDFGIEEDGDGHRILRGGGTDPCGHGTAVAYLVRRAAPRAAIGSFRVLGSNLTGKGEAVRAAVRLALAKNYHIINCSFGFGGSGFGGSSRLRFVEVHKEWIDEVYLRNVHLVAACNNHDSRRIEWPAHFATSITVDKAHCGEKEFFFRPGGLVEFAAKGYDARVPWTGHAWRILSGSSFAAPRIAGGIARLLSVHPHLSAPQMKALLRHIALERPYLGIGNRRG